MSKTNEKTIREMMQEFDEIMAWFSQDEFDVEEAIAKFTEGAALATAIQTKLTSLENKITVLKTQFDESA